MKMVVTGGAGFIGRWLVQRLLREGHEVWVLDDLSNGRELNLAEFAGAKGYHGLTTGDIKDRELLARLFANKFDVCFHLAASINVQDSIDTPRVTFENDSVGTFNVLEECRAHGVKCVFMSTCMVYDRSLDESGITELHATKPASPYAGSKLAAENMALSYYYAYGLPVVVARPFNTYGPYQKSGGEGGVVAIFIRNKLTGKDLSIYGEGTQTRDLLYVEDCADFLYRCAFSSEVNGQIVNAGLGRDVTVNELAQMVQPDAAKIRHVTHIHPQSEIEKLLCNYGKAQELLGWRPTVSLEEGLARTETWIAEQLQAGRSI